MAMMAHQGYHHTSAYSSHQPSSCKLDPSSTYGSDGKEDFITTETFIPELYSRSACLLMLTEFRRLHQSQSLDESKVSCSM